MQGLVVVCIDAMHLVPVLVIKKFPCAFAIAESVAPQDSRRTAETAILILGQFSLIKLNEYGCLRLF